MKNGFKDSKAYSELIKMPTLKHKPYKDFTLDDSEVIQWMTCSDAIMQYLFDKARMCGAIVYDQEKQTWRGKDHKD